jgi:hypothetical protein
MNVENDSQSTITGYESGSRVLLSSVVCPHCWQKFRTEDILWIAQHESMRGDMILGSDAMMRFRPTRFTTNFEALDIRGVACTHLACPRCHLEIPRVLLETDPLFFSVIGVPSAGKSCLYASMTWDLRSRMPRDFGLSFGDADPTNNRVLNEYEETFFLQSDQDRHVAIRKTETSGQNYDQLRLRDQLVVLPRPFIFTMRPLEKHPHFGKAEMSRVICLYDNAGEHFLLGDDAAAKMATQHLNRARVIMFLFDPTQDPRLRPKARAGSKAAIAASTSGVQPKMQRQETILIETAHRIRQTTGLSPHKKIDRPLLVLISKSDVIRKLIDGDITSEPVVRNPGGGPSFVDLTRVESISKKIEALFLETVPEFVAAANDSFTFVRYIPVSAFGRPPEPIPGDAGASADGQAAMGIKPKDISPAWVSVPLLYSFAKFSMFLVNGAETKENKDRSGGSSAGASGAFKKPQL